MQEMLEVRLKDSSFHVNSEWMGNILNEHGLNQSDEFVKTNGTATVHPTSLSQQQQQQQLQSQRQQGNVSHSQNQKTIYSTTSQASQPFCYNIRFLFTSFGFFFCLRLTACFLAKKNLHAIKGQLEFKCFNICCLVFC